MRILSALLFITIVSACSSTKKAQQTRVNAAYDARTEAQRNQVPRPEARDDSRPTVATAPSKPAESPAATTPAAPSSKSASEWVVTSIKGKFLTTDTTGVRVYMNLTGRTPSGETLLEPAQFNE